jgi:DNA-binding transcriptional LysR family regulator
LNADQLLSFVTVVERNSFTRAAAKLGVTQPTVTARVKSLEKELGCRLLDRLPSEIRLSNAGAELLPIAQQILRLVALANTVTSEDGDPRGRVIMGVGDFVTTTRLLPLVEYVYRRYSDLELVLVEMGCTDAVEGVRTGALDCAVFVDAERDPPGLNTVILREEPLAVVSSPDHMEAGHVPSPADLHGPNWIRCGEGSLWQADLERLLAETAGLEPSRNISLTSVNSAKRTVAHGMGFTILPTVAAEDELRDGTLVKARWDPPVRTHLHLVWKDDGVAHGPALRVVDDVLRLFDDEDDEDLEAAGERASQPVAEPTPPPGG